MGIEIILGILAFTLIVNVMVAIILMARSQLVSTGDVTIEINDDPTQKITVPAGGKLLQTLAENNLFLSSACGGGGTCAQWRCQVFDGGGSILSTEESHFNNKEKNDSSLKVLINDKTYFLYLEEESSVSNDFLGELKEEKHIIILSGDKKVNVKKFAEKQNIEEFYSDKSPEEKLVFVKDIQKEGRVIFVGDGINDSPAIKQADVGVTTSSSSQVAQVSGDILIHRGGLETLGEIFNLSKKSKYRIYQNLFLAFVYNTMMIPIAVVGLITPNLAALAMALSSISVVINSSRKL